MASMLFGGISGSSVADTSALGSIEIPAMEKEGYPSGIAAGLTVATSTMGMIIPPSTPMIVYAMISSGSVGGLFLAGAIPGLLIGVTQLILIYTMSVRHGWHPKKTPFVWKEFWRDMLFGIPALLMPVAIVLTISFGVATASESAGVAVFYALAVGFLVYRQLTWKLVWEALKKTLIASSAVMLIIGFSYVFTYIITIQKVPQVIQSFFLQPGYAQMGGHADL